MSTSTSLRALLLASLCAMSFSGMTQPAEAQALPRGSIPLRKDRLADQGIRLTDAKIMGGLYAKTGEDPWQVGLVRAELTVKPRAFCGGSLIAPFWVVTAAHCVDLDTRPGDFDVIGGTIDLSKAGIRVKVAEIFLHPNYVDTDHLNDIALVRLQNSVTAPARAIAILAPAKEADHLQWKKTARVTGWGYLAEDGSTVADLRYVEVPVYSNKDCNDAVSYDGAVADDMVCAGFPEGRKDACQGDSGGPLTVAAGDERLLAGVVSWGEGCGRPYKFGVYTRAARYTTWVEDCRAGKPRCKEADPDKQTTQATFIRNAALRRAIQFRREKP